MLVIPFKPASTPTSRTITVKIESDNLPVRCPMIFFIADRSKYAFLNSRSFKLRYDLRYFFSSVFACRPVAGCGRCHHYCRTHKLVHHSDSLLDLESNSREELLFMKAIKSSSVIRH